MCAVERSLKNPVQHTFFGTKLCWPYAKRPKRSTRPSFQQYQQAFSLLVLLERFVAQNGCHQVPGSERDPTLWIVHVSRASAGINNPFQHRIESSYNLTTVDLWLHVSLSIVFELRVCCLLTCNQWIQHIHTVSFKSNCPSLSSYTISTTEAHSLS